MDSRDQVARVREVFDDWARQGRAEGMERGHGPAARRAFERLELGPASRYLDVGCGNGYTVRWAADACPDGRVQGIDVAPEMIARARTLSSAHAHARFDVATFPDVALEPGFDAIFSMEVFYYLPDLPAGLAKIHELLAPGGRFACTVDFYEENIESHGWPDDLGVPLTLLSAAGWRDAFERCGLEVVSQERLRLTPEQTDTAWKVSEGSLFTLGRRQTTAR